MRLNRSLVALALVLTSCCSSNTARRQDRSEAQLLRDVAAAMVVINTEDALGSGTVVWSDSSRAAVLTCHHVIAEARAILVASPLFETFKVKVIKDDPDHDLALLLVATDRRAPHVDIAQVPPELYDSVWLLGAPLGAAGTASRALVTSLDETYDELPNEHLYRLTGGYIMPGISGGAAVNAAGELVCVPALVHGYAGQLMPQQGSCVALRDIRAFLKGVLL